MNLIEVMLKYFTSKSAYLSTDCIKFPVDCHFIDSRNT